MPKYSVEIKETRLLTFEVEADNEEDAIREAMQSDDANRDEFDQRDVHGVSRLTE